VDDVYTLVPFHDPVNNPIDMGLVAIKQMAELFVLRRNWAPIWIFFQA
jgi:hypothetical protein